jgi:hypothetical protein
MIIEHGFDSTDFKSDKVFANILKMNGLTKYTRLKREVNQGTYHSVYYVYSWKGAGLEIRTGYNPITGGDSYGKRGRGEGFAGYIGIKGTPERVRALVMSIKQSRPYIKDESVGRNDFIW